MLVGRHQGGALLYAGKVDTGSDENLLRDAGDRLRL